MIWNGQFCFDANNYIISLQNMLLFNILWGTIKNVVCQWIWLWLYSDRSWKSKYLSFLADMNWENRNSGNVGRGLDAISKGKIQMKIVDQMDNIGLLFLCSLMREQWFFEIWRLASKSRLKKQIPILSQYTMKCNYMMIYLLMIFWVLLHIWSRAEEIKIWLIGKPSIGITTFY
jgi:hypothetical protein